MREHINYQDFDAATVPLQDSNLIEASAGTGKTYSIAILVLRLILENALSIREILMVTFTKAAVAELEERIRLFVRTAHKLTTGQEIKDENIFRIVAEAVDRNGLEVVQQQVRDAVLFLDETAVLTIHSFCQKTLNEFAFETDQLFGAEMIQDTKTLIAEEVQKFWRKHVTTLQIRLLEKIWEPDMMEHINVALNEHMGGKRYYAYQPGTRYAIRQKEQEEWLEQLETIDERKAAAEQTLLDYVCDGKERLTGLCEGNRYAKTALLPFVKDPEQFIKAVADKRNTAKYIATLLPDMLELMDQVAVIDEERKAIVQQVTSRLYCFAIEEIAAGVKGFKKRNNLLSYDDMITNLHKALVDKKNPRLEEVLREKYKAVFVDEFQDTDRMQYEIFEQAFGENTILFYIGDPKQSIYAWRKADIFTYFKARNTVQHVYGMNHNFRSSEPFIEAMNTFFLPEADFDTFYFSGEDSAINYIRVDSPEHNSKGLLLRNETPDVPISIFNAPNSTELSESVAAQVALLLRSGEYFIEKDEERRAVKPSDIGILVRTGRQGREVKMQLAKLGVPAVTVDDAKVLQSEEATYLLYLMEAMLAPDRSSINRALLSPFTGLKLESVLKLDDEVTLALFGNYKNRWQQDGIYTAMMDFVTDFNVRNVLLHAHTESGERVISNLFQLTELVHQIQNRKNLSMSELVSWLKRGIDGMATEGDEYEQRMESDEEAVNIVTIHKSKGLEYKIVMAPYLDFVENKYVEFFSFRDPVTGDYVGVEKKRMTEAQQTSFARQAEQENRRLLYVAITRAVYKCFIFRNNYHRKSTLLTFIDALKAAAPSPDIIRFEEGAPVVPEQQAQRNILPLAPLDSNTPVRFVLKEQNWRKMSYTMLAAKAAHNLRTRPSQQEDPYETFIFYTLKRGAKTGNLLHFLFENINFSDDSRWEKWITETVRRFVPGQQELYGPMLRQLLEHVLQTDFTVDGRTFPLSAIIWHKRIPEFEFDFPVSAFFPDMLNGLSDEGTSVVVRRFHEHGNHELEGIMNGKMDLFFEHEGRYYILDWKSNYLGGTPEEYTPAAVAVAMNENNYHLQYLIYTLAAKKYLESRLPAFDYEKQFGGVIYCFVRGMRKGQSTGIFTTKPPLSKILQLENSLSPDANKKQPPQQQLFNIY
ncbi:exodeoxyribonuclease V subunit beta [Chitinophaga rhizophila]|uniref:RecBCD enzyme subunit RecB n=1 Tax=Chitinophaga rhizophila TaxID=2866212 RepID=A0ABS7G826_9BACT|nr:exodeoxyribonuclease V subunit beta [Chitinophaga rhizophila]MBW8683816.1 exodeoxyribonuclease V subunit beta [Chitinophaga rhizophila]